MAIEWRPRISSAQILPRGFDGVGGGAHPVAFRAFWSPFACFRTDAPLCDKSGCEEWREGLQRWLHCVSRERGKGCSHGEYGFQAGGYVSGLYGLRRDYARAQRQLEGSHRARRAITWSLADYACVWGSADGRRDQRCDLLHAGVL